MLNLPNILASARILLAPLLLFLLLALKNETNEINISWLNYFCALILDPLADKMLILSAFLGLMMIQRASVWAVYIILTREFFITGFRVVLASQNISVQASFAGKLKTTFQMIAISFLMMEWAYSQLLLWLAVALTLYSGFAYILAYIKQNKNNN